MICTAFLSLPPSSHHCPISHAPLFSISKQSQFPNLTNCHPSKLIPLCSNPSTPLVEDAVSTPPQSSTVDNENLPLRGCKACGREEIEKNCNGEGRIQGGIATVPGFGWWPIKAYRPCPGFLASGGRYRRRGQSMDEVASGGAIRKPSVRTVDEIEVNSKKTKPNRGKFKRK